MRYFVLVAWAYGHDDSMHMYLSEDSQGKAVWAFSFDIYMDGRHVMKTSMNPVHFETREEAEQAAFKLALADPKLVGKVAVIDQCPAATCDCRG
jgi:hypothetical protein